MDPIREAHLSEPGLLVIDVAGRDDATVFALQGRDRPPVGLLDRRAPPGTSPSPVFGCGRSAAGPRGGLPAGAGADGHVERRGPPSRGGVADPPASTVPHPSPACLAGGGSHRRRRATSCERPASGACTWSGYRSVRTALAGAAGRAILDL
ncbi:DUF6207 family protein [Streptomyces griseorubens]|uniref:DUF6207 family protein n=1 Tax=Streptomyces griseorubens TaxID=66897 RepID=UPI001FE08F0C|nr:DUF6207 family protein [Streptomyces griseorubens]